MLHELDLQYIYNRHLIMSKQGNLGYGRAVFSTVLHYKNKCIWDSRGF